MKRLKLLIITLIISLSTFGCFKQDKYQNIKIYTTTYPIEYIVKYLYGDYSKIYTIYPAGTNINEFTLTHKQIKDYAKADMFVYNGLSNEKNYAAKLLNSNKNIDIIDVSKGLEIEHDPTELWLSPNNFLMLASNIKNSLKGYITNQDLIQKIDNNYEELKVEISKIDADLKLIGDTATNKKIITGHNSLKFLNNYGFEVISIADNENSNSNISKAKSLFENKQVNNLFLLDDFEENDLIKDMTSKGATIVEIPNLYTISEEQRKNNLDYIYFIKKMIENIKTEVY